MRKIFYSIAFCFVLKTFYSQINVNPFIEVYNCTKYAYFNGNTNLFPNQTMTITPHSYGSPYFVLNNPMNGTAAPIRTLILHNDSTFVDSVGVIGIGGWDGYFYKIDSVYLIVHLPSGNWNKFYGKKISSVGINEFEKNEKLTIYPNPSSLKITVDIANILFTNEKSYIIIKNTLGQVVLKTSFNSRQTEIDVSNLPNGVYFIELNTLNGILSKKVIISK